MKKYIMFLFAMMFSVLLGATASQADGAALMVDGVNVTPFIVGGFSAFGSIVPLAPSGSLCGFAMVSIPKQKANPGKPSPKRSEIIIFRWSDVETVPIRDEKGIKIEQDFTLKAGTNAISIYATPSEIDLKQTPEGDIDAKGTIQELKFAHPGDGLELQEFLENNLNENLGALVLPFLDTDPKKLVGAPEAPLMLDPESVDNKDGNKNNITLKSVMRGPRVGYYEGAIPTLVASTEGA